VDASWTHADLASDLSNWEALVVRFGHGVSSKRGELLDLALSFFHFSSRFLVATSSVRNLCQHTEELLVILVSWGGLFIGGLGHV